MGISRDLNPSHAITILQQLHVPYTATE